MRRRAALRKLKAAFPTGKSCRIVGKHSGRIESVPLEKAIYQRFLNLLLGSFNTERP
jgi:hypothetical protein